MNKLLNNDKLSTSSSEDEHVLTWKTEEEQKVLDRSTAE